MDVDPQFHQAKRASQRRKARRRVQLALVTLGGLAALGLLIGTGVWLFSGGNTPITADLDAAGTELAVDVFIGDYRKGAGLINFPHSLKITWIQWLFDELNTQSGQCD